MEHAGERTWRRLVGDTTDWASAVWGDYNKLKHNPGVTLDPVRLRVLALTARLLLQIDLLNTAAASKAIGARYASHYLLNGLSDEVAGVI